MTKVIVKYQSRQTIDVTRKGDTGESAYQAAVAGGYAGDKDQFDLDIATAADSVAITTQKASEVVENALIVDSNTQTVVSNTEIVVSKALEVEENKNLTDQIRNDAKAAQIAAELAAQTVENKANKINVIGKNKFNSLDPGVELGHYINFTNGITLPSGSYNTTGYMPATAGVTMCLSQKWHLAWFSTPSPAGYISGSDSSVTTNAQTPPAGANYVRCSVRTYAWDTWQIEIGSVPTAYEPYTVKLRLESIELPEHEHAISDITDLEAELAAKAILINLVGKNKFNQNDPDFTPGHYINYLNGTLAVNLTYSASGYMPVTSGVANYVSYKHSMAWFSTPSPAGYISGSDSSDSNKVQTPPAGANYCRATIHNSVLSTYQFEIGSVGTPWEAYVVYKIPENTYIEALKVIGLTDLIAASVTTAVGFGKVNRIAMPSKQYFLGGYENTIYHQSICERWLPNNYVLRLENGAFQNRKALSRITNPVADASVDANLYDLNFAVQSTKNFALVIGAQATNNGAMILNPIGDSYTYSGAYLSKTLSVCPALTSVGIRKSSYAMMAEGRGGWTLNDYFTRMHVSGVSFSPFMHLADPYKYYGNTAFWIAVKAGTTDYHMVGFSDTATAVGFSATTGLKTSPATNDVMYNDANARYEKWDGSAWVASGHADGNFSFSYAKYRSVWGVTQPNVISVMLGINDFITVAIADIPAAFATWKTQMDALITSIHADSPSAKIALLLHNSCPGGANDAIDVDYPILKYNASLWNARKLMIDTYDNRSAELIYVVDTGSAVDPIFGYAVTTAEKPFSDYAGTETLKVQTNNPHPSAEGYYQIGVRFAGFIQSIR